MTIWSLGLLFLIFDQPHLIPAVGQFEGAVISRSVERSLLEFHPIPLEALYQFQKLRTAALTVRKASIGPAKNKAKQTWSYDNILLN